MDLWQLHIFVSVVENKSFSKASKAIHLSQPTVSSHIKELEESLKCRLLDRLGKTTEPTSAGKILFSYAKKLLTLRDQAESAIQEHLGHVSGELNLGGSTIPSSYIIPRMIQPFSIQYPDISIHLSVGDTLEILEKIKSGSLEIGVVGAVTNDPKVFQAKLTQDEMKLIIPADHLWAGRSSVDARELYTERFIARERGSGTWTSILKSMDNAGFDSKGLNVCVTMGNTISVIQGILNGIGISILSTIAVQSEINNGQLAALTVNQLNLSRHFYLSISSKREPSPIAKKFIEFTGVTF